MKSFGWLLLLSGLILFSSCKEKTIDKLAKKWDCIKVDNLEKVDTKFESPQDSLLAANLKASLNGLSWTFKKNNEYQCSVDEIVTTQGTFEVLEEEQSIICTSNTKNNINRYSIVTLTDNQLVLGTKAGAVELHLHFRPH